MSADGKIMRGVGQAPKASAEKDAIKPKRGRRRSGDGGVDTRDKLLDTAEQLFAERGFYGVSTREVATGAALDEANVYYHFQNKRGLFEAVFERRARVLHRVRHTSLIAYLADSHGVVTLPGALAAFLNPMIDLSEKGEPGWKSYFALVAQIDNTPWGREIIHRYFDPVVQELIAILKRALPSVPDIELFWSYGFMSGSMMMALAETGRIDYLSDGLCKASDMEAMRGRLIAYCVGGFERLIASRP